MKTSRLPVPPEWSVVKWKGVKADAVPKDTKHSTAVTEHETRFRKEAVQELKGRAPKTAAVTIRPYQTWHYPGGISRASGITLAVKKEEQAAILEAKFQTVVGVMVKSTNR